MGSTTTAQWHAAHALADAHGHGWAGWADGRHARDRAADEAFAAAPYEALATPIPVAIPATWEEACERFAREGLAGPCGLGVFPAPDHETGTGRTRWHVYDHGAVLISIYRPHGVVLSARVSTELDVTVELWSASAEVRHLDALAYCLRALGARVPDAIEEILTASAAGEAARAEVPAEECPATGERGRHDLPRVR